MSPEKKKLNVFHFFNINFHHCDLFAYSNFYFYGNEGEKRRNYENKNLNFMFLLMKIIRGGKKKKT